MARYIHKLEYCDRTGESDHEDKNLSDDFLVRESWDKVIAAFHHPVTKNLIKVGEIKFDRGRKEAGVMPKPREGLNKALRETGISFDRLLLKNLNGQVVAYQDNQSTTKHYVLNLFEIGRNGITKDLWEQLWAVIAPKGIKPCNRSGIHVALDSIIENYRDKMKHEEVPDGTKYPAPCIFTNLRGYDKAWEDYEQNENRVIDKKTKTHFRTNWFCWIRGGGKYKNPSFHSR